MSRAGIASGALAAVWFVVALALFVAAIWTEGEGDLSGKLARTGIPALILAAVFLRIAAAGRNDRCYVAGCKRIAAGVAGGFPLCAAHVKLFARRK